MRIEVLRTLALTCLTLLLGIAVVHGQSTPVGGVFIQADDADTVPGVANCYRVYDTPRRLALSFGLNNDSDEAFTIRDEALVGGVRILVSFQDHDVPVRIRWNRQEPAFETGVGDTRIVTGHPGRWQVLLDRADGGTFEGEYDIRLSLGPALRAVRGV